MATSYPKLSYWREHSKTLNVASVRTTLLSLETARETLRIETEAVTPNFFDVLRVRPLLGRVFNEDENLRFLGHPVILSERSLAATLWSASRHGGAEQSP